MGKERKGYYLEFLDDLMKVTGTTKADLAKGMETSWQNIHEKFNKGDMKVSMAEELAGVMGYMVRFILDDGGHVVTDGGVQKNVGSLLLQINDLMPDSGRLGPLKVFLRLHGKSIRRVAEDIGVNPGTVMKYFRDDDTYVSRFFWIAEAYGWKVQVKVERRKV